MAYLLPPSGNPAEIAERAFGGPNENKEQSNYRVENHGISRLNEKSSTFDSRLEPGQELQPE